MMFQKNAKHRANDASNDVYRPPLTACSLIQILKLKFGYLEAEILLRLLT